MSASIACFQQLSLRRCVLNSDERHVHHLRDPFLSVFAAALGRVEPLGEKWGVNATTMARILHNCLPDWCELRDARLRRLRGFLVS
jgi:hypothetical protein